MIRRFLNRINSDSPSVLGKCLFYVVALTLSVIVIAMMWLVFFEVDSFDIISPKTSTVTVEEKVVVPGTWTISFGHGLFQSYYKPEAYQVYFEIDGETTSFLIEKSDFDHLEVGDTIEADYGFTRLTNSPKLMRIRLVVR